MGIPVRAREIRALRLHSQLIEPIGTAGAADVVRHLLAIQAQDFGQALWAVGVRSKGAGRSDVIAALASGAVVRTLPMRGTLHFVASEDLRWMLTLTSARTIQSTATRFAQLGLDAATLDRAAALTLDALAGGGSLGRDEYLKMLSAGGVAPDGQRGYHIIFQLAQRAIVCWGPPAGTQQALVLVDDWIAPTPERDRAEALESFALRYFASHGPATERDFAWWTKLPLRDVRAAIAGLGAQLTALTLDGVDYLIPTSALGSAATTGGVLAQPGASVFALPGFDEYLLGYQDRSLVLDDEHAWRIVPGNNGMFLPMIVSRGEIVGGWRRNSKTRAPEPEHFAEATPAQLAAFARAAKSYARFILS
jgi:hypothetical protein